MTAISDPRTPVLIGAGQATVRVDDGATPLDPIGLAAAALSDAASRCGDGVIGAADSIRMVEMLSARYRDPAALLAARIGAAPRHTGYSTSGGNSPQELLNQACIDIAAGRADVIIIAGAEAWRTRMALRRNGEYPDWELNHDDTPEAERLGGELKMSHEAETAQGIVAPIQMYPMFELALRHAAGRSPADHIVHLGRLWEGFSAVAAKNPFAWRNQHYSATELTTPTPDNRMIGYPYTKLMNAHNHVDQGAAMIVCSAAAAEAHGVATDQWVFPVAGARSREHNFVTNRADLASSPAVAAAGNAIWEATGLGADDVAAVDLYSCFPSAVQFGAGALGIGLDRQLTLTGGLTLAGGPWNNYVSHSIAAMHGRLAGADDDYGLIWANGGFATKHALGLFRSRPPEQPFSHHDPQAEIDALPSAVAAPDYAGAAEIETYTVMYDRDGSPERALFALRPEPGVRAWGTSLNADLMVRLVETEAIGGQVVREADGLVRA